MAEMSSISLWKETTAITKDLAKEGYIAQTVFGWERDHFKVRVWNKDSSRLAFRFSGDVCLRDVGKGFTGMRYVLKFPQTLHRAPQSVTTKTPFFVVKMGNRLTLPKVELLKHRSDPLAWRIAPRMTKEPKRMKSS